MLDAKLTHRSDRFKTEEKKEGKCTIYLSIICWSTIFISEYKPTSNLESRSTVCHINDRYTKIVKSDEPIDKDEEEIVKHENRGSVTNRSVNSTILENIVGFNNEFKESSKWINRNIIMKTNNFLYKTDLKDSEWSKMENRVNNDRVFAIERNESEE